MFSHNGASRAESNTTLCLIEFARWLHTIYPDCLNVCDKKLNSQDIQFDRIIRLHCNTRSSVVVLYVSVCGYLSVTFVSLAKTAKPIEMPFGRLIRVGQMNHVLDTPGIQIPRGRGNFGGRLPPLKSMGNRCLSRLARIRGRVLTI